MGQVGRLYGHWHSLFPGHPIHVFLVGLLVNMPGLVNKWKENLALVMEKRLVKVWQTGQLIWPV